jgi:hypothetical protein
MIKLPLLECPICRKKYNGLTLACSEKCQKELVATVGLIGVAGNIMKVLEECRASEREQKIREMLKSLIQNGNYK